jgi:Chitobiase/beta-hexosaminidase C-terminal domain
MIDPFVVLTPVLVLAVMALVRFIGCDKVFDVPPIFVFTFDPPPGGYFNAQMVTISCSQSGDIHYTTDGSDPRGSSTAQKYTGPIQVSANTTINAYTTTGGIDSWDSPVATVTYIIGPIMFQQLQELDDPNSSSPDPTVVTTKSFTGSIAQNTLMVVWIYYKGPADGSISVSKVFDATGSAGNNYSPVVGPTPPGAGPSGLQGFKQEIWYAIITSTDTGGKPFKVSAQFTAPITGDKAISAHAYVGANLSDPIDQTTPDLNTASASGLTGAVSTGSVTTSYARLVFAAAHYLRPPGGPGAGFTQRSKLSGNVSEDANVTALGQVVQATFTPTTGPWIAQICAFK